jgi:restriction system protein
MAKKTSLFEDLFQIASKLPWWLSALIAISSGLYLHSVATAPMPVYSDPQHLQSVVFGTFWRTFAMFGQYLLPFIFTAGAIASIIGRRKRRHLLESAAASKGNPLLSITWHEFELLVGEALRRRGFSVRETGKNGPDGGIDLIARKDGETYVVQCKQWRSMQVGLPVVRELYGAMAAEGAVGGFVVTSGTFTKPAREFAAGRNVQLVDGKMLKQWITETRKPGPQATAEVTPERVESAVFEQEAVVTPSTDLAPFPVQAPAATVTQPVTREAEPKPASLPLAPLCPHCRKTMVVRVARSGANAGGNFWGCGDYPKCRGIRPIFAPMTVK